MYALDALQFHKETYLSLLFKPLWTEVAPHLGGGGVQLTLGIILLLITFFFYVFKTTM